MSHTESVRIWNSFNLSTHWIHTNSNNNWQTFKSSRCQKLQTHLFGSFVQLTLSCTVFHYIILSISVHFGFVFSLRDLEWNWHALKWLGVTTLLEKWVSVVAGVCVCVCDEFHQSAQWISTRLEFFCICIQMQPLLEFWIIISHNNCGLPIFLFHLF